MDDRAKSDRERLALELFAAACELDEEAARRFLDERCGNDVDLRRSVDELFGFDERGDEADTKLARGVRDVLHESLAAHGGDVLPEQLGRYRIVRKLGSGGMGVVYEALQESPHRSVALKVLRSVARGEQLTRRLQREGEILARLQHPGIAQIYETGTFESRDGEEPYLAMELVVGRDLLAYSHERGLDARAKIELVVEICDAVAHAHDRGVVHRDLKPANVLVDDRGRPRVLDFGVARLSDADHEGVTIATQTGLIVGTLAYMSPEQIDAGPEGIDGRADVYALGAITFELLCGRLPHVLDGLPLHEQLGVVRSVDARPIGEFDRALRGDVETILIKALAKEREARYASARDLAADLRRHLADEPIVARPPSTFYRVGKFARRNRAIVAGVSIAFFALAAGLVVSTKLYFDAKRASERATREASRAKAVKSYMLDKILAAADPWRHGRDVKVVDLLDSACKEVDASFSNDPELRAEALHLLGRSYSSLGMPKQSLPLLEESVELRTRTLGSDAPETLDSTYELGETFSALGRADDASKAYESTRAACERVFGADDERTLRALAGEIATIRASGRHEEALAKARTAVERADRALGPSARASLRVAWLLCEMLVSRGDVDEAEKTLVLHVDAVRAARGADDPETAHAGFQLAQLRSIQGRFEEAEGLLRRSVADYTRLFGPDVPRTLEAEVELAHVLGQMDRNEESVEILRAASIGMESALGPDHVAALTTRNNLAIELRKVGHLHEADEVARLVLEERLRVLGPDHPAVAESWSACGTIHSRLGDHAAAAREYDNALRIAKASYDDDHPFVTTVRFNMGTALQQSGDDERAVEVYRALFESDQRRQGPDHNNTIGDMQRLAHSLAALGRFDEAESLARDALERANRALSERHVITLRLQGLLGRILLECAWHEEAEPLLAKSVAGLRASNRGDLADADGSTAALARLRATREASVSAR